MKTNLRILFVLILFMLSFIGMKGYSHIRSQSAYIHEQNNCIVSYEFSVLNNSCNLLGSSKQGFKDSDLFYHFDCIKIELNEQLRSQFSGSNQFRVRRGVDLTSFLKCIMQQLSFRDNVSTQDKMKMFCSNINRKLLPSCQYYIFALRHIII